MKQSIVWSSGVLFLSLAFAFLSAPTVGRAQEPSPSVEVPDGLSAGDWSSIRQAYEANRYAAYLVEDGYRARNPGQGWQTRFDGRGFTTTPDGGGWTWGLELVRYGFAGRECVVGSPTEVKAEGARVTYDWGTALQEWYVNDARGLEHGYTVQRRPPHGDGPLALTLAVRGELMPEVQDDGRSVLFVDGDGTAVLTYLGLTVFDAEGQELTAGFGRIDEGLLLTVDERGACYPLTIDPTAQQAYLKASNTDVWDVFGLSVAFSGDTVVISAPNEDSNATGVNGDQSDNSAEDAGAAYVFVRSGTTWSQEAYLKASNTDADDGFGSSVAVSGDTLVVGASQEASDATGVNGNQSDNSAEDAGAVYVFVRNGSTWSQEAYLKASNTEAGSYGEGDSFGESVAVSGDTVVVGAREEDSNATGVNGDQSDNSAESAGAAYVFVRGGTTWSQEAYLKASNTEPGSYGEGDEFGGSVAISGDTVVVGAEDEDSSATGVNGDQNDNSVSRAGAAYVFVRSGTTWTQEAYLKASNTDPFNGDAFGCSLAVSGDTVVVGARDEDSTATGVNGNQFSNGARNSGAAYVFVRSGTLWSQEAYLKASNTDPRDSFGCSVTVSGDTVVVGAREEESNATGVNGDQGNDDSFGAGAAYVFVRRGTSWSQLAYLKASNTDRDDFFGSSVASSGDLVVVSAPLESSNATGVNGDQSNDYGPYSGAAYLFEINPFPATVTPRNGTGINATCYTTTSLPVLGQTWQATVDVCGHPSATLTVVVVHTSPTTGPVLSGGEVLVTGPRLLTSLVVPVGGTATHSIPIPDDAAVLGRIGYTQAVILGGPWEACNALDIQLGRL